MSWLDTAMPWLSMKGLTAILWLVPVLLAVKYLDRFVFPKVDFQKQLNERNRAVGFVVGMALASLILSLAFLAGCSPVHSHDLPCHASSPTADHTSPAIPAELAGVAAGCSRYDVHFRRYGGHHFPFRDWRWFRAQATAESSLNPLATSKAGAMGLMQIMPATAKELGLMTPYDARASIEAGIRYDRWLYDYLQSERPHPEDFSLMFAAYNCGPGRLRRTRDGPATPYQALESKLPQETRRYVGRIGNLYHRRETTCTNGSPG